RTGDDTLTPYILFQAQDFGTPDYTETAIAGSPLFALAYTSRHQFDYISELGGTWNTVLAQSGDSVTGLEARLGWQHDYATRISDTATFTGFAGASFTVYGAPPARDAGHLRLGLAHEFDNIALTLNADSTLSGTSQNYGGTASMSFRW
ncbi:MAG TPA: autotransporter outer membrane beta-barrel domain-containing protein, partial [Rhizomicrobium sp.]